MISQNTELAVVVDDTAVFMVSRDQILVKRHINNHLSMLNEYNEK